MSRRWQVYSCTCCDVISLTAWTELSLHIIAAVLRLNVSIPRGLLRGTSFFRKPRCKRDLQRLDRCSSVESHTGGLFCRGNNLSVHHFILYMQERVCFLDKKGRQCEIPLSCTDLAAEDPVCILASGKSWFRAADLVELTRLVEGLRR